ncbi:nuclear transport factor 2 family protein [Streptomyces broussonetiae]|uniref:Nuclear transport factor 2 family protein n=1 Tax=Streptomyces broussonetiae TaxID=2686304 RepID=A0A6I6N2R7_9ACTN|nr:nuclear transport factor 2 family protein [Streptomyces broussonetiae]QHA02516.1 nuclear transport factor 2 family protein [Streptomyces broussonetiae]
MRLHPTRFAAAVICTVAAVTALGPTALGPTALGTAAFAAQPAGRHVSEVVADWSAAWNGTEPAVLGALFTPDGTYTDQGIGVTFHGRQEIAGWKARTDSLIDNVHVTVHATHRDGCHITVEGAYAGHIKGAPRPFAVPLATLLDTDGRRITADQDFYSLNAVLAQSGLPADWTPPAH